jgi:hypothetical protein
VYTFIFVTIFVMGWLILGFIPWLVTSVVTRGNAGLITLPICLLAALVGGLAVPILGKDDAAGIWLSALAAPVCSVAIIAARRFSQGAHAPEHQPTKAQPE